MFITTICDDDDDADDDQLTVLNVGCSSDGLR